MTNSCLRLLATLGVVFVTCGCSELDNCPDAEDTITIEARPDSTDKDVRVFSSSAGWDSFDRFPAKSEIKFKHDLGVPLLPQGFLAFTSEATIDGSFTQAAGNSLEFTCLDSHTIVVKNDTCERSFYIKVVAFGSPNAVMDDDHCDP